MNNTLHKFALIRVIFEFSLVFIVTVSDKRRDCGYVFIRTGLRLEYSVRYNGYIYPARCLRVKEVVIVHEYASAWNECLQHPRTLVPSLWMIHITDSFRFYNVSQRLFSLDSGAKKRCDVSIYYSNDYEWRWKYLCDVEKLISCSHANTSAANTY